MAPSVGNYSNWNLRSRSTEKGWRRERPSGPVSDVRGEEWAGEAAHEGFEGGAEGDSGEVGDRGGGVRAGGGDKEEAEGKE